MSMCITIINFINARNYSPIDGIVTRILQQPYLGLESAESQITSITTTTHIFE